MPEAQKPFDTVGAIMDHENGTLSANETLDLFAELVRSGMAWTLQGSYGRTATGLIKAGWIDDKGAVLTYPD